MKIKQLIAINVMILLILLLSIPVFASLDMGFVQCKEGYVNIRDSASTEGKIVGKIANNGVVYISNYMNGWMEIRSGNVKGFIKSDFVCVEPDAVAELIKTATYRVVRIQPQVLIVRESPSEDSEKITEVYAGDEIEVLGRENGWARVCLSLDCYGWVKEDYVEYRLYHGEAEPVLESLPQETVQTKVEEKQQFQPVQEVTSSVHEEEIIAYSDFVDSESKVYDSNYSEEQNYIEDYNSYQEEEIQDSYYDEDYSSYQEEETYDEDVTYYEYIEEDYYEENYNDDYVENNTVSNYGGGSYLSEYAQQYIGNPYVWGGTSLETGADCSGFTLAVLEANGISVNGRTAADQAQGGTQISLDEAEAGDLIYYDNGSGVYHIAIYNGDGTVTHSSSSTTGVTISDMNYSGNAAGAVRYW